MNSSSIVQLAIGFLLAASCELFATPSLVVRVVNISSAAAHDLGEMKASASEVFKHSGIEIEWIACSQSRQNVAVCPDHGEPGRRTTVFVALVDEPVQPKRRYQGRSTRLGWADDQTSSVAIFYRTACEIGQKAPLLVTKGQVLGHAVAHEIGHLLLGAEAHSLVGVMKENYNNNDLLTIATGRLWFTAEESRLLRERVLCDPAAPQP